MQIKSLFLTIILLFPLTFAYGQFYLTGENPATVKWSKIESNNYTIIFPREIDSLGIRYLWLLENNRDMLLKGLNINPKRFPVIINPYTVNSNGMVTWAPKRMEIYSQPPSDGYAQNWEEQLVYHETRHVGQIDHFSKGIFSVLDKILGEQINGLGVGVYVSKWFMEGDAVVTETQFTNTGRGREASFLEYYRLAELSGHRRDWNRWRYGSYKHYTPGPYEFGYVMQSTVRFRVDMYDYPGKMLDRVVKRFYNPWANTQFDAKYTGNPTQSNLSVGLSFMNTLWKEDLEKRGKLSETHILHHKPPFDGYSSDYNNSLALTTDSTIFIKTSFSNPTRLVLLSSDPLFRKRYKQGEKHLRPFSGSVDNLYYSKELNRIYFNEPIPHPRWGLKSYNKVFYYDIAKNTIKKVSKKTSYNNPSLNSAQNIAAVAEYHIKGGSSLVLINPENGKIISSIEAPFNGQLTECTWVDNYIYATVITHKGMGMYKINSTHLQEWETVINDQFATISTLRAVKEKIYFVSGIDGVSNAYLLNTSNNTIERVTNSKYGVNDISIKDNYLFGSEVNLTGRKPIFMQIEPVDGIKLEFKEKNLKADYTYIVADTLSQQAKRALAPDSLFIRENSVTEKEFAKNLRIKPYRKFTNLFHIHSWAPIYYNPDKIKKKNFDDAYETIGLGVTVMSQNLLGTAVTLLGYSFKKGFNAGHINFTYSGWYPVIEIQADINDKQRYGWKFIEKGPNKYEFTRFNHNSPLIETTVRAYIPLNLSSHGWRRSLTPQVDWDFNNNTIYSYSKGKDVYRNQVNAGIQYSQMRATAKAAIFPKWGYGILVKGGVSPVNTELFGQVGAVHTFGYFPGLLPRHGIKISAGYQRQFDKEKLFYLDNILSMPRGISEDYYATDYTKLTFDYAIPMYLKDYSIINGLVYFQRLRVTPYVDYAFTNIGNLYTFGGELALDAYFLQIGVPVTVGLRYGHNGGKDYYGFKRNVVQFIFNVSLN